MEVAINQRAVEEPGGISQDDVAARSSDLKVWSDATSRTLSNYQICKCNLNCKCGGLCMYKVETSINFILYYL